MEASTLRARVSRAAVGHRDDLLCVVVLLALALAFFAPALTDGGVLGGFDLDSHQTSLLASLYASVHSNANGDAASQMATWNALNWRLVHGGHFPLWNDYSVLGMPEFLNFESGVLSLPDLVSYAAPLREAFLTAAVVKLALAGTGTYLAGRVLGLRPLSALFAGATFMLSGAFVNWVTWPLSDVVCWSGFLLAFTVLAYRTHRWRDVVLLAISVAFSIYGGFPEGNVMIAVTALALALGAGVVGLLSGRRLNWRGALRPLLGGVVGVALAAPLWLPGLQVISLSHRTHDAHYVGLPMSALGLLFAQGYDGLPNGPAASNYPLWPYYESVAYVGVIAAVLAVVALVSTWRHPLVVGLGVALVATLALSYEPRPFQLAFGIVNRIPELQAVRFERIRTMGAFVVALLGGVGLEQLLFRPRQQAVRRGYLAGALAVSATVGYLLVDSLSVPLHGITRHARLESLLWPLLLCGALLLLIPLVVSDALGRLRSQLLGVALVVGECAFLFTAGVGIPTYGHVLDGTTPAMARLQAIVGRSLVGIDNGNTGEFVACSKRYGVRSFGILNDACQPQPRAGLYPNLNVGYGLRLFGVHDPLTPAAYYASWPVPIAAPVANGVGLYVPAITSATIARRYGIAYILAPSWVPTPSGTRYVTTLSRDERLYAVPGAARFSFSSSSARVVSVDDGGDGSISLVTAASQASRLVLDVTALPGWHLNVDGKPVALATINKVEESAVIPAGRHQLHLEYLPARLVVGLVLCAAAVLALVVGALAVRLGHRRQQRATGELRSVDL